MYRSEWDKKQPWLNWSWMILQCAIHISPLLTMIANTAYGHGSLYNLGRTGFDFRSNASESACKFAGDFRDEVAMR
jgi:hypothetical protein